MAGYIYRSGGADKGNEPGRGGRPRRRVRWRGDAARAGLIGCMGDAAGAGGKCGEVRYPMRLPGATGRSTATVLSEPSWSTAERIMPWLSMPLMVRGARLAM